MALAALLVYSVISCVDNCWFQFAVPFWHSIRPFFVGILHKLGHNLFNKFLHYIWELVQHGGMVACRIVPIHASGSTSLFTQTGLNEVAHSGHNRDMTANAFFVDSPRSVQTEWYQVPHFGFELEIQLSASSAPSCCLHDWHFFNCSCRVESFPSVILDLSKHSCWQSPSMSFLGPLPHFEQVPRLADLVIEFQDPWKLAIRIVVRPNPRMFREESLGSVFFLIGSVHEFYRLKALITFEQVNTSVIKILLFLDQQD